jgi:hypothetical protein
VQSSEFKTKQKAPQKSVSARHGRKLRQEDPEFEDNLGKTLSSKTNKIDIH